MVRCKVSRTPMSYKGQSSLIMTIRFTGRIAFMQCQWSIVVQPCVGDIGCLSASDWIGFLFGLVYYIMKAIGADPSVVSLLPRKTSRAWRRRRGVYKATHQSPFHLHHSKTSRFPNTKDLIQTTTLRTLLSLKLFIMRFTLLLATLVATAFAAPAPEASTQTLKALVLRSLIGKSEVAAAQLMERVSTTQSHLVEFITQLTSCISSFWHMLLPWRCRSLPALYVIGSLSFPGH